MAEMQPTYALIKNKDKESIRVLYERYGKKLFGYARNKPVSGNWKTIGVPKFEDVYWQNAKYNEFPALNMTRKGAELYCD